MHIGPILLHLQTASKADQQKLVRAREVINRLKAEKVAISEQLATAQNSKMGHAEAVVGVGAVAAAAAAASLKEPDNATSASVTPVADGSIHHQQQQQIETLQQQLQAATEQVNELKMDLATAQLLASEAQKAAGLQQAQQTELAELGQDNMELQKQVEQLTAMLSDLQQQNLQLKQQQQAAAAAELPVSELPQQQSVELLSQLERYKFRAEEAEAAFGQLHEQAAEAEQQHLLQIQQLQQQCAALQSAATAAVPSSRQGAAVHVDLAGIGDIRAADAADLVLPVSHVVQELAAAEGDAGLTKLIDSASPSRQGAQPTAAASSGSASGRQGVTRRDRAAAVAGLGSQASDAVVIDMEARSSTSPATAAAGTGDGAKGLATMLGGAWESVAAAVQNAVGAHSSRYSELAAADDGADGAHNDDDDNKQGAAISLRPRDLQLGSLRPFGAYQAVRAAHPGVQNILAKVDGAWVRVMRFVNESPGVRGGLVVYLLLVHVMVMWVRATCQQAALSALAAPAAALGGVPQSAAGPAGLLAAAGGGQLADGVGAVGPGLATGTGTGRL